MPTGQAGRRQLRALGPCCRGRPDGATPTAAWRTCRPAGRSAQLALVPSAHAAMCLLAAKKALQHY